MRLSATRDLRQRGSGTVRKVQLKHVTASALLEREAVLGLARRIAGHTRRYFRSEIDRRAETDSPTHADKRGVAIDAGHRGGVVDPRRHEIKRGEVADHARHAETDRRRVLFLKVVRALDGRND